MKVAFADEKKTVMWPVSGFGLVQRIKLFSHQLLTILHTFIIASYCQSGLVD